LDIQPATVSGIWWRHIPAGRDVYYEPPDPADNRWQRGAEVEALYFADSEPTAWAEWYRYLAEAALPPQPSLPRDLWRWEISLSSVADLRHRGRLACVGLPAIQPTRLQWPAFQSVGEQLHQDGWPGSSARRLRVRRVARCVCFALLARSPARNRYRRPQR